MNDEICRVCGHAPHTVDGCVTLQCDCVWDPPPAGKPGCKARSANMGANDPQDCDWPFCGCDPQADKVISAIQESGFEIRKLPAGKQGEPDFGTHEQVIAGLDAINEHNRAEIAINQAFYDIVPLIFGTVEGGADKVREILRGLRNSSHSEAICAAAEVVDKFRGWQNEEFEANLIERILALAPSLAQPDKEGK